MDTDTPILNARFREALTWAAELHALQTRKGSSTPYIGHLLAVASIVIEHGGDEDQVVAALLHDAIEDQGGDDTRTEIRTRFGARVVEMVRSRGSSGARVQAMPSWCERTKRGSRSMFGAVRRPACFSISATRDA